MLIFGQSSSVEHVLSGNKPKRCKFFRTMETILSQRISFHYLQNPICKGIIIITIITSIIII
jgi:hypothetical protein